MRKLVDSGSRCEKQGPNNTSGVKESSRNGYFHIGASLLFVFEACLQQFGHDKDLLAGALLLESCGAPSAFAGNEACPQSHIHYVTETIPLFPVRHLVPLGFRTEAPSAIRKQYRLSDGIEAWETSIAW
jgi:hypothetical protein